MQNKKKGFSLIELIVVIAVMAVLVGILAPSLLTYVEKSREQKDESAMEEVVEAIKLALADEEIYNELSDNDISEFRFNPYNDYTIRLGDARCEQGGDHLTHSDVSVTDETPTKQTTVANGCIAGLCGHDQDAGKLWANLKAVLEEEIEFSSKSHRAEQYKITISIGDVDTATTVEGEFDGVDSPFDETEWPTSDPYGATAES